VQKDIPQCLTEFRKRGGRKFRCDDGDWNVRIEAPPSFIAKHIPEGSLLIAGNGCGDHLFLKPSGPRQFGEEVFAYWHDEGPSYRTFAPSLSLLTDPPAPSVSAIGPVYYPNGVDVVRIGDQVSVRYWIFFGGSGDVRYVPGLSKKVSAFEHHGLCWVGVKVAKGGRASFVVDPTTRRLHGRIRLIKRAQPGATDNPGYAQ